LQYGDTDPAEALVEMAASRNWRLYELVPERRTLEQIFIELTCSDTPEPAQVTAEAAA
jgi:ABC-2 type transport system ATP-binding protein